MIWLEAIPLSDIAVTRKEADQRGYHPNWSEAIVGVGSRVPSEAMRRLLAACNLAHPLVAPREALERLAVLRMLERPA